MPEGPIPSSGGGGFNPFKNLSPKQKRYAAVIGAGGLLALVVVLSRRGAAAPDDSGGVAASEVPASYPGYDPYSTFADNGAAASELSSAVVQGLGDVQVGLEDVRTTFEQAEAQRALESQQLTEMFQTGWDQYSEQLANLGPEILGAVGAVGGQVEAAKAQAKRQNQKQTKQIKQTIKGRDNKPGGGGGGGGGGQGGGGGGQGGGGNKPGGGKSGGPAGGRPQATPSSSAARARAQSAPAPRPQPKPAAAGKKRR